MEDIKTNIDKIVDELNFYMRQYPNTYSEVKHLLFEIEEQEQEIRNKVIDEFAEHLKRDVFIEEGHVLNKIFIYEIIDATAEEMKEVQDEKE